MPLPMLRYLTEFKESSIVKTEIKEEKTLMVPNEDASIKTQTQVDGIFVVRESRPIFFKDMLFGTLDLLKVRNVTEVFQAQVLEKIMT